MVFQTQPPPLNLSWPYQLMFIFIFICSVFGGTFQSRAMPLAAGLAEIPAGHRRSSWCHGRTWKGNWADDWVHARGMSCGSGPLDDMIIAIIQYHSLPRSWFYPSGPNPFLFFPLYHALIFPPACSPREQRANGKHPGLLNMALVSEMVETRGLCTIPEVFIRFIRYPRFGPKP